MEMKQLVALKTNRVLNTRKKSKALNIRDNRTNPHIQLITSIQDTQYKISHPISQFVKLKCKADVKTDRYVSTAVTTNRETGTHWAEQVIKNSPFAANFEKVTNMYPHQTYRTPYSCAEPKALARAIARIRDRSIRFIKEATIYPAEVVAKEYGDSNQIKVGDTFNRCLNCKQWAGEGKSIANIQVAPRTLH